MRFQKKIDLNPTTGSKVMLIMRTIEMKVDNNHENLMIFVVKSGPRRISQHQERLIGGLKPCTHYAVTVEYNYYSSRRQRTRTLNVKTACVKDISVTGTVYSSGQLVVIILCSSLLALGMFVLLYFLRCSRRQYQLRNRREVAVIDMKDLMRDVR